MTPFLRCLPTRSMALGLALWLVGEGWALGDGQAPIPVGPDKHVQVYRLETVEVRGTNRLTAAQLVEELGLKSGTPLNDDFVMATRSRLLSLGLFNSAILVMRKGSRPGMARLVLELEDEPNVLTAWALGGELDVTASEESAGAVDAAQAPLDYRMGLVGRNLFGTLHRGAVLVDFDNAGIVRAGQFQYGLPRFTQEATQFDFELAATDAYWRYLDVLGFGARGQALWSHTLPQTGEMQYGVAMYLNRSPRFAVRGFPEAVAGPKVGLIRETRLRTFFPGDGHRIAASLLAAPIDLDESVAELELARTWAIAKIIWLTLETKVLSVGADAYAARAETRIDVPFGQVRPDEDQAEIFLRLRGGHDIADGTSVIGSAAIFGLRYHSSGFIAELALKVTRSPEQLAKDNLDGAAEGAP